MKRRQHWVAAMEVTLEKSSSYGMLDMTTVIYGALVKRQASSQGQGSRVKGIGESQSEETHRQTLP